MTTHTRHRLARRVRPTRWPSPEETGFVFLCYPPSYAPPAETDEAPVLSVCGSLDEARSDARMFGGAAIYRYTFHTRPAAEGGDVADDERFVEVIWQ